MKVVARNISLTILYVALGLLVAFFAVTRTEVGRDALRVQLERSFDREFEGELRIGYLSGNLVNDLYARDVRILGADGGVIVSVDSVVIRPRWRDMLRQTVSIRSVTFFEPHFNLVKTDDDRWNIEHALSGRREREVSDSPWRLSSANIRIRDGSISTTNTGSLPVVVQNGNLFDFTNTTFERISMRATVDWRRNFHLIDFLDFSARLAEHEIDIRSLRGQLIDLPNETSLNGVSFSIGQSRLAFTLALDGVSLFAGPLSLDRISEADLRFDMAESFMAADELRTILPNLPLRGAVELTARVSGPVANLAVNNVTIRRADTDLRLSGTVRGLPEYASFTYDIQRSRISVPEMVDLLPLVDLAAYRHLGVISLLASGEGTLPLRRAGALRIRSEFEGEAASGRLSGTVQLRRSGDRAPEYTASLRFARLDFGRVLDHPDYVSDLNGRFEIKGRGFGREDMNAQMESHLRASSFQGRTVDSLQVVANAVGYRFQGYSLLAAAGGALWANGFVDLNDEPTAEFHARAEDFDAAHLVGTDEFETRLNGLFAVSVTGRTFDALSADASVILGNSTLRIGDEVSVLPAFSSEMTIDGRNPAGQTIEISGDVLDAKLTGRFTFPLLADVAQLWAKSFERRILQTLDKPFDTAAPSLFRRASMEVVGDPARGEAKLDQIHLQRDRVAGALLEAGLSEGVRLDGALHVKRGDVLAALIPGLDAARTQISGAGLIEASESRFFMNLSLAGDSTRLGSVQLDGARAGIRASAALEAGSEPVISISLTGAAPVLRIRSQEMRDVSVDLVFDDARGSFKLAVEQIGRTGSLDMTASIRHLAGRNEVSLDDFRLSIQDRIWQAVGSPRIDLYGNAAVFHHVVLENRASGENGINAAQRLTLDGAVSNARRDTTYLVAEDIVLDDLSELLALKRPFGGVLNGTFAFTAFEERPEAVGDIVVDRFTFADRLLGRLRGTSRYSPDQQRILLDLSVRQRSDSVAVWMQNDLTVSGAINLGTDAPQNETGRRDLFDLDVQINSADLFFFEMIFPNLLEDVRARLTGQGRIRGDFAFPLFSGDFSIPTGQFVVPEFNLAYEIRGPLTVDRRGIHLDGIRLSDSGGGTTRVSGGILFNEYRYFSFNLSGRLNDMLIMNVPTSRELPFYGRIWLSGSATLTGPISGAFLRSADLTAHRRSELFIPVTSGGVDHDEGFLVFADSAGTLPDLERLTRRSGILAERPVGERTFLEGLDMNLNLIAPRGSTVHLVFDPLLGDVINAVGSGRIQLQLLEGTFSTFGTFDIESGDYLFTAGELFTRRFLLEQGGTITWDGDPVDARLEIPAIYRTRASLVGLPGYENFPQRVPLIVRLDVSGRVQTPAVGLSLQIARDDRLAFGTVEGLETILNQPDRSAEYATSVLLTNTFLLTTTSGAETLPGAADDLFFNSLSQLVANQLNRFVNQALTNVEFTLGVQSASAQDLDLTYGIALRLMDERLIIRGSGVYESASSRRNAESLQGEFVVEVRLNPRVSVEVFYRREEDLSNFTSVASTMYGAYGAGVSYQTDFTSWRQFWSSITRWVGGIFS